jgi:hypothetical protein
MATEFSITAMGQFSSLVNGSMDSFLGPSLSTHISILCHVSRLLIRLLAAMLKRVTVPELIVRILNAKKLNESKQH